MISIIIPTFNEAGKIHDTLSNILTASFDQPPEIIVADGGSKDATVAIAKAFHVKVLQNLPKGRSVQLNKGAAVATGEILYFLHADSTPPPDFLHHIVNACSNGSIAGCFRLSFDHNHWFLKSQCWFTRFNINALRFGDQSLFVTKEIFEKSGGFREDHLIMEDQEIIHRLRKHGKFKVMEAHVTTSARKYLRNGVFRMQMIFYTIWLMYYLGFTQSYLVQLHKHLIRS